MRRSDGILGPPQKLVIPAVEALILDSRNPGLQPVRQQRQLRLHQPELHRGQLQVGAAARQRRHLRQLPRTSVSGLRPLQPGAIDGPQLLGGGALHGNLRSGLGVHVRGPGAVDQRPDRIGGRRRDLGEAFYRISALLLDDPSLPLPVRYFTAVAINPAAVFNDLVLGPPPREPGLSSIPWNGRMYLGTLWLSDGSVREQVLVGVDLSYGVPEEPGDGCQKPFETFDLKADFGFLGSPTGDGFIRGLIAGCRMGSQRSPASGVCLVSPTSIRPPASACPPPRSDLVQQSP